MTFEGNLTAHDVYEVLEWEDALEIARCGQKLVTERDKRNIDMVTGGFNTVIKGLNSVVKAIGNLGDILSKVFR